MTRTPDRAPANRFLILGAVVVTVAALRLSQEVLIPIALAILFSFLLAPLVRLLERVRLPRVVAVLLSVIVAFSAVGGIGYVVYNQLADLTTRLPGYTENVKRKIAGMEKPGHILAEVHEKSAEVRKAMSLPASQPAASQPSPAAAAASVGKATDEADPTAAGPPPPPQRVEVVNPAPQSSPLTYVRTVLGEVLGPAGTAFIVVVFTIFMLLQREDLRDRVIRLVGRERLTTTTQALDDAAGRVSKYLLLQSIVNGSVGLVVFCLLWLVGRMAGTPFPSPALWGLLSALLRFIPYIGIWMSALVPVLLSLAVFASFKWTVVTLGVYLVTELTTANAIEPLLFGSSTGIGTLAVLVAAAFWTWLWGPVGLLLSTPLTVCLVVMGKYVPALEFLSVILSDEPALSAPDRVYQRLLAGDNEEAADLIHDYAKHMPLEELYDTVLLPAVAQAEADHQHGGLTPERRSTVNRSVLDLVDELGDRLKADGAAKAGGSHGKLAEPKAGERIHLPGGCVLNVVCLPAHDESDALGAHMLGQLLAARGFCVTVLSQAELTSEMVGAVEAAQPDAVVISALPPAAVSHARYLCKRLQGKVPDVSIIIGLWATDRDLAKARDRIGGTEEVQLAGGLRQAIGQLHELVQPKLIQATMAAKGTA